MTEITRSFTPDWTSPPGDTIVDILEERNWTQVQLAEAMGYTTDYISLLINGEVPINEEIALKLEQVLGSTALFWLSREVQYRVNLLENIGETDYNPVPPKRSERVTMRVKFKERGKPLPYILDEE